VTPVLTIGAELGAAIGTMVAVTIAPDDTVVGKTIVAAAGWVVGADWVAIEQPARLTVSKVIAAMRFCTAYLL